MIELKQKEFFHRDIKNLNIFFNIEKNGKRTFKIGDFGCAKNIVPEEPSSVCGTPFYFNQELILALCEGSKKGIFSFNLDLWSLGVSLYRLAFNRFPWGNSLNPSSNNQHQNKM